MRPEPVGECRLTSRFGPPFLAHQRDEHTGVSPCFSEAIAQALDDHHVLVKLAPDRHHEPSAVGELRLEACRNARRGGSHDDAVERCAGWIAEGSIAFHNRDVRIAEPRRGGGALPRPAPLFGSIVMTSRATSARIAA